MVFPGRKGQAVNAGGAIALLVVILMIGIIIPIAISLNADISTDMMALSSATTSQNVIGNTTEKVNNAYQTSTSLPTIYVAVLMIGAVLGIISFMRAAF